MPALYSLPIHISPLLHADVMVFPDDNMVETGDADDIARLTEYITRVYDGGVEPTDEERLPGNQLVLRIQIQTSELDINTIITFTFVHYLHIKIKYF